MPAPAKTKLRELVQWETSELETIAKATSERVDRVRRANALLAVSQGKSFSQAAQLAGFKTGDGVMLLVKRFNQHGLAALNIATGRGPKMHYQSEARRLVITTLQQAPSRSEDQSASPRITARPARPAPSVSIDAGVVPTFSTGASRGPPASVQHLLLSAQILDFGTIQQPMHRETHMHPNADLNQQRATRLWFGNSTASSPCMPPRERRRLRAATHEPP